MAELHARLQALEISSARVASEKYPQTIYLQQINGVGPITSLYLVLKIENPQRFTRTRNIGAFVGLCPKRDQSGGNRQRVAHQQMRRPLSASPAGERRAAYPGTLRDRKCA